MEGFFNRHLAMAVRCFSPIRQKMKGEIDVRETILHVSRFNFEINGD
jgi:hypothetical protein